MVRILVVITGLIMPWLALGQPVLYLQPDAIGEIEVGTSFTVEVRIADFEDLRAYSIDLHYNQAAVMHTHLTQGNVFSVNGGPGGIFLTAASDPERGYIKADEARVTGGSTSGADGFLFRVTFLAIAPGSTNVGFGQVQLRNAANEPLTFEHEDGVVAVVSPTPDVIYTRMFDPEESMEDLDEWPDTGGWIHIDNAGPVPHGKVSVARYTSVPPGGEDTPFVDPDGQVDQLGVTSSYWEVTSSLSEELVPTYGFSYFDLDGPEAPTSYRVARRALGSGADSTWTLLSASATTVDPQLQLIVIDGSEVSFAASQYALVFNRAVSSTGSPDGGRHPGLESFPNPVVAESTVRFKVPNPGPVVVRVSDMLGRVVLTLVEDTFSAGEHEVIWSARTLPSGTYIIMMYQQAGQEAAQVSVIR